jgi:DNA-binding transcriptional LysR family regulator
MFGKRGKFFPHVRRAAQLAQATSRGEAGALSIAILPPIGGLFLPPAIRAFRKRFPVVALTILDLLPQEQIPALMDRRIDLGFVPLPVVELNSAIEFEPVREVELMVALPPDHRLAKQHRLTLRRLANEPFVMLKRSSAVLLHDWVSSLCREAGIEPQVVKRADGPTSILELVSSGFGVAPLPEIFARFPSDVVFRPLPVTTPKLYRTDRCKCKNQY